MRVLLVVGLLLAFLAASGVAEARMHHPYRGHRIVVVASGPLDGFTTPSGAYSFRKLRSAYAGSAIRIRRASDNAELDIGFLGYTSFTGAPWDEAAAAAHCAATDCFVVAWYDQSGSGRHLVQATGASQPRLVFNCLGTKACLEMTASTQTLLSAAFSPATGLASLSMVAARTAGTGFCIFRENTNGGQRLVMTGANSWIVAGATGNVTRAATDGVWHTGIGVASGVVSASSLMIDGVATTGTVTVVTTAGNIGFLGAAATTCRIAEGMVWDNLGLSAAEQAVLDGNQRGYWGPF